MVKNSAIVFGGTMFANFLAYLYHLIVGRMLGPARYGELAALISIYYILNAPSTILQNIMVKFFSQLKAKNELGEAKQLFISISKGIVVFGIIAFILLVPFTKFFASYLNIRQPVYLIWLYLMFATYLFSIIAISMLQGFQKFIAIAALQNIGGALRLIVGVIGATISVGWTLFLGIIANVFGYLLTLIPLRSILSNKPKKISMSAKSAIVYSVPTFIAIFCMTALYSQDVVLVKHFFPPELAGIYSSLSVLGKIIFFASSSVGLVSFPLLAERKELGKEFTSIVFLSLVGVGIMSFGLTLGYYLFPSLVVNLLFGKAFLSASVYLGSFGLFISFYTLANLFVTMYLALGETLVWIFAVLAAAAQTLTMNIFHSSLHTIIWNNTLIVGILFLVLLIYYPYVRRKS